MDSTPCHGAREHKVVWGCSCQQPALNFCHDCLPLHTQSLGQHNITPLGPMAPSMCGMCKGQSADPITCQYPVCSCQTCVQRLSTVEEPLPIEIFGGPNVDITMAEDAAYIAQEAAKHAAEAPIIHTEANLCVDQPAATLQELFLQRKNEMHQSIMRTMDNMNGLEDTFFRALAQEGELQLCRNQLANAQDEIRRLQALLQHQVQAASVNEAHEEALRAQLDHINNTRHQDQEALQNQISDLSAQVSQLKSELQQSVRDQVEEQVRENQRDLQESIQKAVLKVSDVIPLVLHLDEEWLDHDGAERLMDLASLGINNEDMQPGCMRQVARVCAILAKASGPCEHLATFAKHINKLLERNSQVALQLLIQLEELYLRYRATPTAKASLQKLLGLAESEVFNEIVASLLNFADHLDAAKLTVLGDQVMDFLLERTDIGDKWGRALLDFPVKWSKQCEKEMEIVVNAIVERKFDLRLVQLLQVYQPDDPSDLMSFFAFTALLSPQVVPSMDALIQAIYHQVFAASKSPSAQAKRACSRVFSALRLVNKSSTPAELEQVTQLLSLLRLDLPGNKAVCTLVNNLAEFEDEATMKTLMLGSLNWLFPGGNLRADAAFLEWLIPLVCAEKDNAEKAGLLLSELGKLIFRGEIEQSFGKMMEKLPLAKALDLSLELATNAKSLGSPLSTVVSACVALLEADLNPLELADRVIALLKRKKPKTLEKCIACYTALNKRRSADAYQFTSEVLAVLSVEDDEVLLHFLHTLAGVLNKDNIPQDSALKTPRLWLQARLRLPDKRMVSFCIKALEQRRLENLLDLLTEAENVFKQEGASYSTAMKLLDLSLQRVESALIERPLPAIQPSMWLTILGSLRRANGMEKLFESVNSNRDASARLVTGFVELVLSSCQTKPEEVEEICITLERLLKQDEAFPLLKNLTALENVNLASDLLTTVRLLQDPSILTSCLKLSELLLYFQRDHVDPPDLLHALQNRGEDLTKLVEACILVAQDPAHHMTALTAQLLRELDNRRDADLLSSIADTVKKLLETVEPDLFNRIEELGQELIVVSRYEVGAERVRKLQEQFALIGDKLVELLRRSDRISIQALEQLIARDTQTKQLVRVSASALSFFDFKTFQWGNDVPLIPSIQVNSGNSSWVILEDQLKELVVFCCGGINYTG